MYKSGLSCFFFRLYVTRNCFILICTQLQKYFTGNIQKLYENKRNISVKCRKYMRNKHLMEIFFKHRYAYVWHPLLLINYRHSYRNIFIIIQLVVVFHLYCQSSAQQSNLSWEPARTVFFLVFMGGRQLSLRNQSYISHPQCCPRGMALELTVWKELHCSSFKNESGENKQ